MGVMIHFGKLRSVFMLFLPLPGAAAPILTGGVTPPSDAPSRHRFQTDSFGFLPSGGPPQPPLLACKGKSFVYCPRCKKQHILPAATFAARQKETPPLIAKDGIVFSVFHRPGAPRPLPGAFLSCVGKKGSKEADRGGAECRAPARQSRPPLALPGAHLVTAKRRI